MISIFFMVVGVVIFIGSIIYSQVRKGRIAGLLSGLAEKYGLTFFPGSFMTFPYVSGQIDFCPVRIEKYTVSGGNSNVQALKFEFDTGKASLHSFSITAEGFFSQMKKVFGKDDLLIGDESFDQKALIQGFFPSELLILLNKKARSLITFLMNSSYRNNCHINESKITCFVAFNNIQEFADLQKILDTIIALAEIFCRKGAPVDLLKENYLMETEKGVKKRLLEALGTVKGSFTPEDPIVKNALGNKSVEIQFLGARLLKKEGYDRLKRIYGQANIYVKKRIINYLKNEKEACFLEYFLKHAENESSTAVKQALADYFRVLGDARAEPFLRKELDTQRDYESLPDFHSYKLAVVNALKYCGTYESIERLYHLKQLTLKREVDEAIAMIQERIGTGDKGWLSMTPDSGGEGGLSLTDEQDGNE